MSIAFVFPGQGSQIVGMGRELYEESEVGRAVFDQADETLGFALSQTCFEGPAEQLLATENAQPALLTTSIAVLATLSVVIGNPARLRPPHLAFVAGHSLGEYSALVAARALDLPTALRLVRRRGELMAAAREGSMAAIIGLEETILERICFEASAEGASVVIANYNAPGQLVISGATAAVERAGRMAREHGARHAMPLKVSAAFHSPLMRVAAAGLAELCANAKITDASVPVISNVTAAPLRDAEALRRELIDQVTAPVRWIASVQRMVAAGVNTFVEIGPGVVLTKLIKRIAPDTRQFHVADMADIRTFLESVSRQ